MRVINRSKYLQNDAIMHRTYCENCSAIATKDIEVESDKRKQLIRIILCEHCWELFKGVLIG